MKRLHAMRHRPGSRRPRRPDSARQRYLRAINLARIPAIIFGSLVVAFSWVVLDLIPAASAIGFLVAGVAALALSAPFARLIRARNVTAPAYLMLIVDTGIIGLGAWAIGSAATGIPVFFAATIVASALVVGGLGSAAVAAIATAMYAGLLFTEGAWVTRPAASWGALGFHAGAFLTLALVSSLLMRELNQALERARRLRREAEIIHQINRLTDRDPGVRRLFRATRRLIQLIDGVVESTIWQVGAEGLLIDPIGDAPADHADRPEPLTLADVRADRSGRRIVQLIGSADRPSGLLVVDFAGDPHPADRDFLRRVAGQISLSLERVQLQAARRAAEALLEATYAPSTSLSLRTVAESVAEQGAILTLADAVRVSLADRPDDPIDRAGPAWPSQAETLTSYLDNAPDLIEQIATQGAGRPADWPGVGDPAPTDRRGVGSAIGVELSVAGDRLGSLIALRARDRSPFDPADRAALWAFANRCAQAVQNARLYERLVTQIEEVRRTQAWLVQSAKLAAIGELSANVAHEINNPLTSILMSVSLILETDPDETIGPELRVIHDEALRARDIVRNLLDFARQNEPRLDPIDVNQVLDQTLALVGRYLENNHVRVIRDLAARLPRVSADSNQLKQVFLNLINNAVQAMPNGGSLCLSTGVEEATVVIRVADTGLGIPADVLPRIFEPFFSTKGEVKGTGLGLSVSHGIVSRHQGSIQVNSEVGRGTTFRVALPAAELVSA